ncbi:hypothetical protein ACOMHN_021654 [Nucella lapillus]
MLLKHFTIELQFLNKMVIGSILPSFLQNGMHPPAMSSLLTVCMRRDKCGAMAALAGREHIRTTSPLYTVHDDAFFSPEPDAVAVAGAGAAPQP